MSERDIARSQAPHAIGAPKRVPAAPMAGPDFVMGLRMNAAAEAFYDWRYHVWHRFRYIAGAEWELNHRVVLEGYYVRQRDNRSSTKYVNAAGIVVQLYFP